MRQNNQKRVRIDQNSQLSNTNVLHDLLLLFADSVNGEAEESAFNQAFLECVRTACHAEAASIWKLDERSRLVLFLSTDIVDPSEIKKAKTLSLTKGTGISGKAVLQRKTLTYSSTDDAGFHDERLDKALGRKTRSMISSPIVWGARNVFGVVNVINVSEDEPIDSLKETVEIAARLYADFLIRSAKYDAPSYEEAAHHYPYLIYEPDGSYARIVELCEKYAPYDDTVLLLGETGSGKELFARVIYEASGRPGPFLTMNCGASRLGLNGDELFGHIKGAYTGADSDTEGFLGTVGRGTLFLDEIGALPPECQPALLRLLDNGEYNRIGEPLIRKFQGRIIAATQLTLIEKVRDGRFMEDLAYRLERFVVHVPPLRECRRDIPRLREHFLSEGVKKYKKTPPVFSEKATERFLTYTWPGNVRQLCNVIFDAIVSFPGGRIDEVKLEELLKKHTWKFHADSVEMAPSCAAQAHQSFEQKWREACKDHVNRFVSGGINKSKVAKALCMDRHTLNHKMKELSLKWEL